MKYAITYIETEKASKYLSVLCRHFSRKVAATWNEAHGEINFPVGRCMMIVNDNELLIECRSKDEEQLEKQHTIIDSHLHLFSRREPIEAVWQYSTQPARVVTN